jgi:hypothetical protein
VHVTDKRKDHPLRPNLAEAEVRLQSALEDVCVESDVPRRNTDELIRMEEALVDASEAAKRAISIRRKIRADA